MTVKVKNRSIPLYIILSLITCGLFSLYWFYCLTEDSNALSGRVDTSGGLALLLNIVTCGIYGLYWAYQLGNKLDEAAASHGKPQKNQGILYLILNLIGFSIITYAIAQSNINDYA